MAGTIVADRIESDATYDSKIELVSPVLVSNTFAVKSTGGTGVFNIVGANTNTDRTFTLPDVAGTVVTEVVGNEAYKKQNILGTVSESSGVPTGAIIERGSNANGEYVKYADGTLICTKQTVIPKTQAVTTDYGGVFGTAAIGWTYPATFIAAPLTFASTRYVDGAFGIWADTIGEDTNGAQVILYCDQSRGTAGNEGRAMAIGRWF